MRFEYFGCFCCTLVDAKEQEEEQEEEQDDDDEMTVPSLYTKHYRA